MAKYVALSFQPKLDLGISSYIPLNAMLVNLLLDN